MAIGMEGLDGYISMGPCDDTFSHWKVLLPSTLFVGSLLGSGSSCLYAAFIFSGIKGISTIDCIDSTPF